MTATMLRIPAHLAAAAADLAPRGTAWTQAGEHAVPLAPTPLEAQPSAYVRTAWAARSYGTLPSVAVAAAVAGGALHVRLRWAAPSPRTGITDNNVYADACALLFPADGREAVLATMGDDRSPVEAWHWRAGTSLPFVLTARGAGTSERRPHHDLTADAAWDHGEWAVVFRRSLTAAGVPLRTGDLPFGIAIWQGANEERAGLASHTPAWLALEVPRLEGKA
ncbi:MAG: hypothetical protein IT303_18150 [Dehalococcoidia bacterium]|nr:hypothetical protein [Dehalococcoidia bacterium]